jgi:hypothetical protein
MTRTCSDCPGTVGKYSKSGRCKACAMRVMHADPAYAARRDAATRKMNRTPEIRAKRSAALKARYADPAARKAMSEACLKRLAENPELAARRKELGAASFRAFHAAGTYDWVAHHRARVDKRLAWCPADRRDEYKKLRDEYGAAEARRMVEQDIAASKRRAKAEPDTFERQLARIAAGAAVMAAPDFRTAGPACTLGGVASGMI